MNKELGISPGEMTLKYAKHTDAKRAKKRAVASTREGKLRRNLLKCAEFQAEAAKEIREGTTYESGIALEVLKSLQYVLKMNNADFNTVSLFHARKNVT